MDLLGRDQEPTILDWTERELVGLDGERFIVSVTHIRGSRRKKNHLLYNDADYGLDCSECDQHV